RVGACCSCALASSGFATKAAAPAAAPFKNPRRPTGLFLILAIALASFLGNTASLIICQRLRGGSSRNMPFGRILGAKKALFFALVGGRFDVGKFAAQRDVFQKDVQEDGERHDHGAGDENELQAMDERIADVSQKRLEKIHPIRD